MKDENPFMFRFLSAVLCVLLIVDNLFFCRTAGFVFVSFLLPHLSCLDSSALDFRQIAADRSPLDQSGRYDHRFTPHAGDRQPGDLTADLAFVEMERGQGGIQLGTAAAAVVTADDADIAADLASGFFRRLIQRDCAVVGDCDEAEPAAVAAHDFLQVADQQFDAETGVIVPDSSAAPIALILSARI